MSGIAVNNCQLAGQSLEINRSNRWIRAYLTRLTAGSSRRSVLAGILADFVAVQCAAITALLVKLVWLESGVVDARNIHGAGVPGWYILTLLPFSGVLALVLFLSGGYSVSRLRKPRQGSLLVLRACVLASALYTLVCWFGGRLEVLQGGTAMVFMTLSCFGVMGLRYLKLWVDAPLVEDSFPRSLSLAGGPSEAPVLVIGGAGYIGSVLVRRLIASGRRVRVLDSLVYGNGALKDLFGHPNLEVLFGDCRNIKSVVRAVDGVDTIVLLAAIVGDPACEQDRQAALETNYAATRMLIEVAKGAKVRRLVFASSCSVYGASEEPTDETSAVNPISLYAQTKVQSERALLQAASEDFQPIILRLATVFGLSYRPRFDLVVNLLTAKAYQEGVITIYNGEQWRPFIHVRDVVEAIVRVLEAPVRLVGGEIFNVGDTRLNHTLTDVADVIRDAFPNVRVDHVDNSDRRNYRVNFDKLLSRTGFRARYTLRDGVEELRKAFDEGLITDYTDLRYHNQRYLKAVGSPGHKAEEDALVMAAFSNHRQNDPTVATAKAAPGPDPWLRRAEPAEGDEPAAAPA